MIKRTLYHFHFCCGLGGGAAGFNRARPRVGNVEAEWVCLGGIDVDPAGLRDFERLAGVPGTLLDLFTRDQYVRFHGKEPPAGWREATPEDVRRAAQGKRPDAVFISSPCKGASGLLSEKMSLTPKYQALNELTLRCIWLMGEAWADDPVPLIVFENVPRLASRGRHLLDQINSLLGGFGYAVAETTHDCGELGGLAQSRKRFLLVARHVEKVPPFLYEPEKKSLRAVGDILGRMPLPGDIDAAGPMHRVPSLQWKTWVRLALVRAGSDRRSLMKRFERKSKQQAISELVDFHLLNCARIEKLERALQTVVNAADHGSWPTTVMHGIEVARAMLAAEPTSSASPSCKWTESSGIWETGCGQTWGFVEDGPAENGALFCHHCGGRLVLIKSDDQEDDGEPCPDCMENAPAPGCEA